MKPPANGLQKVLTGLVTAAALAYAAWVGNSLVAHGQQIATAETRTGMLTEWLERVERKLDRALGQ